MKPLIYPSVQVLLRRITTALRLCSQGASGLAAGLAERHPCFGLFDGPDDPDLSWTWPRKTTDLLASMVMTSFTTVEGNHAGKTTSLQREHLWKRVLKVTIPFRENESSLPIKL